MPRHPAAGTSQLSAGTFGGLLHHLRRKLQLTQRDLGLAVGYGEAQISRLEKNHRHAPDLTTLVALFVPALHLEQDPGTVARLLELAAESRGESLEGIEASVEQRQTHRAEIDWVIESPPPAPPGAIARTALVAHLRDHLHGDGALIVCGLPGMGKTTLAADLARDDAQAGPVCWMMIRPGVNDQVGAVLRNVAATLYRLGRDETGPVFDPARDAGPLPLERALTLIGAASQAAGGLLVCLDNAHLLLTDPDAVRALNHLHSLPAIRLLLTSRVELPLAGVRQEWLEGLAPDEGRALLARLCPALEPELADELLTRVSGSPILIRLAAGQLRTGGPDARAFINTLATQPQIGSYLLESVLGQLSAEARELIYLVATFRRPVDLLDVGLADIIQHRLSIEALPTAIDELQRHHLVPHPDRAGVHPLLRDRISAQLALDRRVRQRLHRAAAAWLEHHNRDPLEAGHHALQAGDWGRVADLLADQAERLLHQGQARVAVDLIGQALARLSAETEPDLARRLLIGRGDLLVHSQQAERADDDYRRALTLTTNAAVRAHITIKLADSLIHRGRAAEALQLTESTSGDLTPADTLLRAQLASSQCSAQLALGRYDDAVTSGERALQLTEQIAALAPREADSIRAPTHNSLGAIKHMRGYIDEALRQWSAAAAAARRANLQRLECRAIFNIGNVYLVRGELQRALEQYQSALAGLERSDERYIAGRVQSAIAVVLYMRGELDAALDAYERAIVLKQSVGDAVGLAHTQGQQARTLLALGRTVEARALIEQAIGATQDLGPSRSRAGLFVILSEAQLVNGTAGEALATLEAVYAFPGLAAEPWFLGDWQTHMAAVHLALGSLDAARALASNPVADTVGGEVSLERALVRCLLTLAGEDPDAARRQAADLVTQAQAAGNLLIARRAAQLSPDPCALWGVVAQV